jgi:hypothetical protein
VGLVALVSSPSVERADAIAPKILDGEDPVATAARIGVSSIDRWPEPHEDGMLTPDLKRARVETWTGHSSSGRKRLRPRHLSARSADRGTEHQPNSKQLFGVQEDGHGAFIG